MKYVQSDSNNQEEKGHWDVHALHELEVHDFCTSYYTQLAYHFVPAWLAASCNGVVHDVISNQEERLQ